MLIPKTIFLFMKFINWERATLINAILILFYRVSEEKETVVQELHGERESYEKQLITMVNQQERILQEREGM